MSYLCYKNVNGVKKSVVAIEESDENLCAFIAWIRADENYIITDSDDNFILTTNSYFIDDCPNKGLLNRLVPILEPYQQGKNLPEITYSD